MHLRNELDLAAYFSNLGVGKVDNVVLCRNWSKLKKAVQKRAFYLMKLEETYVRCVHDRARRVWVDILHMFFRPSSLYERGQYLVDGHSSVSSDRIPFLQSSHAENEQTKEVLSRMDSIDPHYRPTHRTGFLGLFGEKVDSATYYASQFLKWEDEVKSRRIDPENSGPTSVAIVTFENALAAQIVAQVAIHSTPFTNMVKLAPEPRDIYWPNLTGVSANPFSKLLRSVNLFLTSAICFYRNVCPHLSIIFYCKLNRCID